jgi:hypothetical protein
MKKSILSWFMVASMGFSASAIAQSADYPTLSQINQRMQQVAKNSNATLTSLVKTAGGKDIWVLKVGTGALDEKPAIAVVGGVEGFHVLSTELAIQFAEKLVAEHSDALANTTLHFSEYVARRL